MLFIVLELFVQVKRKLFRVTRHTIHYQRMSCNDEHLDRPDRTGIEPD